jgi:hypothetical protein
MAARRVMGQCSSAGSPLGLLSEGVPVLAGVLLPSAAVFLPLCNDKEVLGPWVNDRKTNMFTAAVVAILVSRRDRAAAAIGSPSGWAGRR